MTFFDRVKELVKFKNRTIKSFIEELGLNYGSYNTLRKSHNLPRGDECVKIANALGTTVEYLVTGVEPEQDGRYKAAIEEIRAVLRSVQ